MTALEKYNKNKDTDENGMQEPKLTPSGLYIWEQWTWNKKGDVITDIRYYAEDKNGGNTIRLSMKDFIFLSQNI